MMAKVFRERSKKASNQKIIILKLEKEDLYTDFGKGGRDLYSDYGETIWNGREQSEVEPSPMDKGKVRP